MHIKIFLLFALLGIIGLLTPGPRAAEKLYKLIDQNGKVSYQDRPPIDDKSTVLEKTFESRTNSVRPDIPTTNDLPKLGKSDQKKELGQKNDNENKTTKGLSSEELTAIAIGNSTGDPTDEQTRESAGDEVSDDNNDSLTQPREPVRD